MSFYKILLSCALVFSALTTAAQLRVMGVVTDEKGQPLAGANVWVKESNTGLATNGQGQFYFQTSNLPLSLEISFIGYSSFSRKLSLANFTNGEIALQVKLNPLTEQLPEVVIRSGPYVEFFAKETVTVQDYIFVNDLILLLSKKLREQKLILLNEREDTLAIRPLSERIEGFETDCLGHIYLLAKDSLIGLSFARDSIFTIGKLGREWFEASVKPCIAANDRNLYYRFYTNANLRIDYFQTPIGSSQSLALRSIFDRENIRSVAEYRSDIDRLIEMGMHKKAWDKLAWYNKILTKPIFSPLVATDSGAVIFDFNVDSVLCFDSKGKRHSSKPIENLASKGMDILQDHGTDDIYLLKEERGVVSISRIRKNLSIGTVRQIDGFVFPENRKIRNGVVYFLAHDTEDYNRLKLYRQKL